MAIAVAAFSLQILAGSTAGSTASVEIGAAVTEKWIAESVTRLGTTNARLATWSLISDGMTRDGTWLLGGSAGSDDLHELCTGMEVAPAFVIEGPKCPVESRGLQPLTRDPHNFAFYVLVHHGVVGLTVLLIPTGVLIWRSRRLDSAAMPIAGLGIYLGIGLTFPISAGYALIPMALFLAWLLRNIVHDEECKILSKCDRYGPDPLK